MSEKKKFGLSWCLLPVLAFVALIGVVGVYLIVRNWPFSPIGGGRTTPIIGTTGEGAVVETSADGSENQFGVRLSAGMPQPQATQPVTLVAGEPLTTTLVENILARLPALVVEAQEQVEFRLPEESLPPPKPGETIQESFPAPAEAQPPEIASGPLEVLRYAPEGEIPLAPFVSVTFNQPMVPLGTLEDLAAEEIPLVIEPALPGTWRWVGTKTLTFEYDSELIDRLPKATEYTLSVPAGTKSATGGMLAQEVRWTFTTPPPKLTQSYPSGESQPLQPLIFISFDQRIEPQAVLKTIDVSADGKAVAVQLASQDEIKGDKRLSNLIEQTGEGRWLVLKLKQPLPKDAGIQVRINPGTPSAEGPLKTTQVQSFNFRTYAPLRITEHDCSWWDDRCPPLTPFYIRFNNPLDAKAFKPEMITIQPELPAAVVDIIGTTIQIRGETRGQTTYRITVSGEIQDIYGQKLGKDESLSFRVGTTEPFIVAPERLLVTLDPAATKPFFSLYTMNYTRLDVRIYAVQPADWPAFTTYLREYYQKEVKPTPPGRKVMDKTINLEAATDELYEAGIDLSEVMDGKFGHFIVIIQPRRGLIDLERNPRLVQTWVQVTQIGLDAHADHSEMVAWVNRLSDGAPLADVPIIAGESGVLVQSDAEGVARFNLPAGGISYLSAQDGADVAILPAYEDYWGDARWKPLPVNDLLRWYVFDDRGMYKPGEEVHIKGWLRRVGGKQDGDVGLVGDRARTVNYIVYDPMGNELLTGSSAVNPLGGFDLTFSLPENTNLGYAQVDMQVIGSLGGLYGDRYYHPLQIQEFRRPEFEVQARNESVGPYFVDGEAVVAVAANYYAGGPLPNAGVTWHVSTSPSSYSPPNWPDFTFGTWHPWWRSRGGMYIESEYGGYSVEQSGGKVETFEGVTDAAGEHYLKLDFDQGGEPQPYSVLGEASVMDVNRQAWADSTSLLVHPADLYVGLRSQRTFVERGQPLKIDLIVTDLDGNPVEDRPILVTAQRMQWKYSGGRWVEETVETQECKLGSTKEPVNCTFTTEYGGSYLITAQVHDELGRLNQSQMTRWVSGGNRPISRKVEQEEVTLIPDKESYQPGDTAHILVQSPFSPAEGMLIVSRSGILYNQRFTITDGTITLEVPIKEEYIPNLNIQVDLVGATQRLDDQGEVVEDAPDRSAYATGQLNLSIPPLQRTLDLQIDLGVKELEPGGETTLTASLKDANGNPMAGAELAVVVVDEAILALSNYQMTDPISAFYLDRSADVYSRYLRGTIVLVDPQTLAQAASDAANQAVEKEMAVSEAMEMPMAASPLPTMGALARDEGAGAGPPAPISVRSDFNPLATFAPAVLTDLNGQARVEIKVPDNLTRYRVMVVAVDSSGRQFGSAESNLTARLPLMVRPSAPRFLNFGDKFELPVVLQNQTDDPLQVDVVVQAGNLALTGPQGIRVQVPGRDRIEVRFPMTTVMAGTARLQIAAVSGEYADAATLELPVYTPATTEAFATYGVVDQGALAQPVKAPSAVFSQFGGLEITTSSTALQALTDAVLYLVSYPYECSEQLSSRILGVAALRDVLSAFKAEGLPSPEEMEKAVARDIERLAGMQNNDGGFPYWRRGYDSIPFNSIHAAHALQRAKLKGFEVPEEMQMRLLDYLREIESHYPSWYGKRTSQTLSAYALYVRNLMGDRDTNKARKLLDEAGLENLSLEAVGWIWQVLVDDPSSTTELEAIRQHVGNRVVETAGAANFTTNYNEQSYLLLESNRRTDAVLLDTLILDSPESDLIPKLVAGLLAHRKQGRWYNTQENLFVLLALDRYFNTYEAQTPDFVARIWLGDTYIGAHEYEGRTTEKRETQIPMAYLLDQLGGVADTQDLVISKDGVGRLYYRLGLRYAPTDLQLDALDMGFVVQRVYEAVDDPGDVTRGADGVWHIKAGARVRVRLTMVADNRRYHVALVDPLPAGLEIVNPALAVSGSVPQDPNSTGYRYGWWWWSTWYEHQNMRDERAEAFSSLLWDGVYTYTYVARATTPGVFVVPPAKAEEMYSPEVFGRSSSDIVIIK